MLSNLFSSFFSYISVTQALLIGVVTVLVLRWLLARRKTYPPGPTPLPIVGNALDFKGISMTEKTCEWMGKYGPVFTFYMGMTPTVFIGSIEAMTEAYVQRGTDFSDKPQSASLDAMSRGGNDILFSPYSDGVKYRRKVATQALRQYLTESHLTDLIDKVVKVAVAGMLKEKGVFDPHPYMSNAVFNILHIITFGYPLAVEDPKFKKIMKHLDVTGGQLWGFWEDLFHPLTYFPTKTFQDYNAGFDFLKEYVDKNFTEQRSKFDGVNPTTLIDDIILAKKHVDDGGQSLDNSRTLPSAAMLSNLFSSFFSYISVTQALLIGVVTVLVLRWLLARRKTYPPGPTPLPIVGNALDFKGTSMTEKTCEWMGKYGPVFTFYMGMTPTVLIGSIEAMTEAYVQRGTDFSDKPQSASLDAMSRGGNDILFSPYSDGVKYRRKVAMQALRQYLTESHLTDLIDKVVKVAVAGMLKEKGVFDPHPYMSNAVFNILHIITFGYPLAVEDPKFKKIMKHLDVTGGQLWGFWEDLFHPLTYFPTKTFQEYNAGFDFLKEYVDKNFTEQRSKFDGVNPTTLIDDIILAKKHVDDGVSEGKKCDFTDTHAGLMILDLFFAGSDTTKDTFDWLLLILAARPDIQKKMQDEIDSVVGDAIPGREHRPGLVYTEAFIMEGMRMYPVAPVGLQHLTMRDTQVGGFAIPANTEIIVNQYAILNDPKHWENPRTFRPERFIEDDGKTLKQRPKSWIPFSLGPRNCIGEFMAKMNILYTLVGILQKLSVSRDPDVEPNFTPQEGWLTYNARPYKVVVKPRHRI